MRSDVVTYQAQQTIFEEGDVGDYMYVILKGKIAVKVGMQGKKDIKVLVAMPSDGDAFGELSAIDFNKIKTSE